jgi:DNA modification methylase
MSNRTADRCEGKRQDWNPLKDGRWWPCHRKANPGNVINCHGGGGHMGSKLAHENEAPFPEKLAEFFVKSFCPPDGTVLDPFCGSGTTLKVAIKNGRQAIGYDIRECQTELSGERVRTECV